MTIDHHTTEARAQRQQADARAEHWLILHGRYVCVARNPHCGDCLIRDLCEFRGKTGK